MELPIWKLECRRERVVRCRGWGNNELLYYTASPKNLWLQESCLHIAARQEPSLPQLQKLCAYTSVRIDTRGRFSFCYGRVEIRAICPAGTGLWSAVWMMLKDSAYGPWAASGEIDILEVKGCRTGSLAPSIMEASRLIRCIRITASVCPKEIRSAVFIIMN